MEQQSNTSDKYTWSYSSMSLFQQCPRKYYRLRVTRDIVEPPQEHLLYGTAVHKAAEDYISLDKPLHPDYEFMRPQLDVLKKLPGTKYCEYEMGLTKEFEPCKFNAPNVWLRGIADLLVVNDNRARIVDYKTGKSRFADTKQLELLSLLVFKHFPYVTHVKAGLVFVVAHDLVTADYTQEKSDEYWMRWLPEIDRLEQCFASNTWNPKQNFTCKKFCPVTDCEHNGRS